MSLFENIGKKVADTTKVVARRSSDIVEVTKLNMSIGTEEGKIAKAYTEMGKFVYEAYIKGEEIPETFKEHCEKIKFYEESVKQLKDRILELKNEKICPSCGTELELEVLFCPKCGAKQEVPKPPVEDPAPAEKVCPSCSTKYPSDTAFCSKCGTKLG